MEKLIYSINGINYILFEIELPIRLAQRFESRIKIVNGIIQYTTYIEKIWNKKVKIKYLIPENNVLVFNNLPC